MILPVVVGCSMQPAHLATDRLVLLSDKQGSGWNVDTYSSHLKCLMLIFILYEDWLIGLANWIAGPCQELKENLCML